MSLLRVHSSSLGFSFIIYRIDVWNDLITNQFGALNEIRDVENSGMW